MGVTQTSMESFKAVVPKLSEKQQVVYDTIHDNPGMSNHDIARFLHWEINTVTPRVNELRDKGVVDYGGDKVDRLTDRKVMTWRVID